jgi:FdhD protein
MSSQSERHDTNAHSSIQEAAVLRWDSEGGMNPKQDWLVREEPLEIRVRGRSVAVAMRTPGHDEELAAGFLLSEGVARKREDVIEMAHCRQGGAGDLPNTLNVFLGPDVEFDIEQLTRHVFASSSCGICGRTSIDSVLHHFPPVDSVIRFPMEKLIRLPDLLRSAQTTFEQTGALHGAALFDQDGQLIVAREDVGRHNAVDKALGHAFLAGKLPLSNHILLVTSRASFEIMQKALAARIPIVAAVSAPSGLAVEFARESGQTLVGFLRGGSANIYSHPERVKT